MEFIFYFLLRRYFVSLTVDSGRILLRKGLLLRRYYDIPSASILLVEVRRTPLLRLFRGKRVTLRTLSGSISFYLRRDEELDCIASDKWYPPLKPRISSVLAGAFARTKALGGAVLFSATVVRVGNSLGSGYYEIISEAISNAAGELSRTLQSLRITVPKIATVIAVFVSVAWLFAFLRNLIGLSRFRIYPARDFIKVSHGVITLYEMVVVRNNLNAAIRRDTAVTLLTGAAPVFCGREMILPPLRREKRRKAIRLLFSAPCEVHDIEPPAKALLGHVAVPLGWGGVSAALLILTCIFGSDPVLRTLLWGALLASAWFCVLYGVYMYRSGCGSGGGFLLISARHGTELLTVYAPEKSEAYSRYDSNLFQRRAGMCDLRINLSGRVKLRLRNISAPW